MALEKKNISLDLVQGSDTKANPQIDSGYQDMENVVFTGDMTVKKMNGFDLLDQLPAGDFSLLTRRQSDLLAISNNGAYKYFSNTGDFAKISELGTSKVNSTEIHGKIIGFSTNYRCYVENINGQDQRISFYSHDGILVNQILNAFGNDATIYNRMSKVLSIGDVFYICETDFGTGTGLISFGKHVLNPATNAFEYVGTWGAHDTTLATLSALDYFTDGTYVFCIYSNGTTSKIMRWNTTTPATPPTVATFTATPKSNVEIFERDALNLYVSYLATSDANPVHKLSIVLKSSLAITSTADLLTYTSINNGAGYNIPFIAAYPTSDTTAVAVDFRNAFIGIVGAGNNASVLSPLGKIFLQNGNYYIPCFFYNYSTITTALMKIVAESGRYSMYPQCVSDSGNVRYQASPFVTYQLNYLVLNSICLYNSENFYTSFTPENQTTLVKFNSDSGQSSNYLEIEKTNIISSGLPSYFDGIKYQEYGFLGCPQITEVIDTAGGSLPADAGYQLVAIYEYTDVFGNVFYSQYSQIFLANVAASHKLQVIVQSAIMTYKDNVIVKLYMKRTNKLFQLVGSAKLTTTSTDKYSVNSFNVTTYPSADVAVAPYQDGSVQPELITNSEFMGLYADRVFTISKDNPIALSYSQMKLEKNAFEFNESTFIIDVLDKRGVAEDDLKAFIAMDGRLIIFKENSILYINGTGPSRANSNDDFSMPLLITTDAGCTEPRSIVLTPNGVMFKSDKGIYLLDRKLQVQYLGASVERFNPSTITSAILVEGANEVRFTTLEGEILVYNYFSNAWSWFTGLPSLSACVWNNQFVILTTDNKIFVENKTHKKIVEGLVSTEIIQKVSSPWIRMDRVQGWEKAYEARIIGAYKSLHRMTIKVFYDYELYASETYEIDPLSADQYNITTRPTNESIENGTAINGVYQMRVDLVRKNCQAFRIEITDVPLDIANNTGESFALSNITFTVGLKKGAAKIQASKSY